MTIRQQTRTSTMNTIRLLAIATVAAVCLALAPAASASATYDPSVVICHLEGTFNGHPGPTHFVKATTTFTAVLQHSHVTTYDIVPPFTTNTGRQFSGQHWDMHLSATLHSVVPGPAVYFWLAGCHS